MKLAVLAIVGIAGAASAQTIVNNIPGTFVDISGTGTNLGGGDDSSYAVTVGAGASNALFPAGTINMCTNGHAGYGGADTQYSNGPLPASFLYTGTVVAPFWDDLITQTNHGGALYAQTIGNTLILQWNNMDHYFTSPTAITFQVQIFGGGSGPGGALAQYLYHNMDTGDINANGASATIGVQTPTSSFQYSLNTASVQSGTVLSIVPAPSSLALLGLGGLLAGRRRR